MANSRISGANKELAIVDTSPGSAGYFTFPVGVRGDAIPKLYFSIRENETSPSASSVAIVTLQFKCEDETDWTDYYNDGFNFSLGDRKFIDDSAGGIFWRAGVKEGNLTSGSVIFGFDW